jgi:hypothetical protein
MPGFDERRAEFALARGWCEWHNVGESIYEERAVQKSNQGWSQQQAGDEPPSLREALKLLPNHCLTALSQPATQTFVRLKRFSSWWSIGILLTLTSVLTAFLAPINASFKLPFEIPPFVQVFTSALSFLISAYIQFIVGRRMAFRLAEQNGTLESMTGPPRVVFTEQCYTTLLPTVPAMGIEALSHLIPQTVSPVSFVMGMYTVILNVLALRAVHNLGLGRALIVYIAPGLIALVLIIMLSICAAPFLVGR